MNTLRELIFAGTNFCGFCGFGLVPAKFFKCEKQRSNNSQNGSNFISSKKSAKLSSHKKSQNCEPQKLVPAKNSSLKVIWWEGLTKSIYKNDLFLEQLKNMS